MWLYLETGLYLELSENEVIRVGPNPNDCSPCEKKRLGHRKKPTGKTIWGHREKMAIYLLSCKAPEASLASTVTLESQSPQKLGSKLLLLRLPVCGSFSKLMHCWKRKYVKLRWSWRIQPRPAWLMIHPPDLSFATIFDITPFSSPRDHWQKASEQRVSGGQQSPFLIRVFPRIRTTGLPLQMSQSIGQYSCMSRPSVYN